MAKNFQMKSLWYSKCTSILLIKNSNNYNNCNLIKKQNLCVYLSSSANSIMDFKFVSNILYSFNSLFYSCNGASTRDALRLNVSAHVLMMVIIDFVFLGYFNASNWFLFVILRRIEPSANVVGCHRLVMLIDVTTTGSLIYSFCD